MSVKEKADSAGDDDRLVNGGDEIPVDESSQLVKLIQIGEYFFHMINLDGELYLITDDVFKLVKYNKPVALKILKSKNMTMDVQELRKATHAMIFSEFDKFKYVVKTPQTEESTNKLQVVALSCLPTVLEALNCPHDHLQAVKSYATRTSARILWEDLPGIVNGAVA